MEGFNWTAYVRSFHEYLPVIASRAPWQVTSNASDIVSRLLPALSNEYETKDGIAIHKSSVIENNVTLKGPLIIGPDCFIAANCYLRGGVFLIARNSIGPGCEIKSSFLFPDSKLAHFNFVGDSLIGEGVNFEAGAIIANHYNERADKNIYVMANGRKINTQIEKFGALIGDGCKIGANAVLSPGTILASNSSVKRLELVDQTAVNN